MLTEIPSASETVNDVSYTVVASFTFSGRFKEAFCYVAASRTYVNAGFPHGAELPDPNRRLQGTGKLHRHFRVATRADLEDPELRRLIHLAADRAEIAGGPVAVKPQVTVRGPAAKKRRKPAQRRVDFLPGTRSH